MQAKNSNLKCENNIIDRCAGYLLDISKNSSEEFDSNIYVQNRYGNLGTLKGRSSSAKMDAASFVHENLKDDHLVFVLVTE